MGFEGKLSADSDVSAAMHALAQHNDNASHIAFIDRLRESSSELIRFGARFERLGSIVGVTSGIGFLTVHS